MPEKLIGRQATYVGKTLWEIVGNLKNFGVGRLVYKDYYRRYPEVSYLKIVRVQPLPVPTQKYVDRKVMVWVEQVFRGMKEEEESLLECNISYYHLIPKSEEAKYLNAPLHDRTRVLPAYREMPPLLRILMEREAKRQGKPVLPVKTRALPFKTVVIKDVGTPLISKRPKLWADYSVSELRQKIEELKMPSEETGTPTEDKAT